MKLLFFDIDETLIPSGGAYPPGVEDALRKTKEKGHKLFINTGRVRSNVEDYIFTDVFSGIVCGCGTHIIYEGNELLYRTLPRELCHETALLCRKCNMYALFEHKDHTCYDAELPGNNDNPLVEYFRRSGRKLITDLEDPDFVFDKFTVWYNNRSDVLSFKEGTKEFFNLIDREGDFYEMEPRGFSKATGMQFLMDYFGCGVEDVIAFGDSNNDIEMLKKAGTGIAMGNATDELKSIASFVTDDINHDGIRNALIKLKLI